MTKFLSIVTAAILFVSCTAETPQPPLSGQNKPAATPAAAQSTPVVLATPAVAQSTPASVVTDASPRISLADAKKDFDAGSAVFIDTHVKEQYDVQHISGAINIPYAEFEKNLNKIPKGKKIIAYCS